jgi:UrcA family protein
MKSTGTSNDLSDTQETIMKTLIASTKLPRLVTTAIFSVLALSCGAVSIASDNDDVPQAVVKFADLNLSNPHGAAKLYHRIVVAAYAVCRSFDIDIRDLTSQTRNLACVHKAIADAVTKVGQPELIAIYNANNHQPLPVTVAVAQAR